MNAKGAEVAVQGCNMGGNQNTQIHVQLIRFNGNIHVPPIRPFSFLHGVEVVGMSLDDPPYQGPLQPDTKNEIIASFWPHLITPIDDSKWDAYFTYCTRICRSEVQHQGHHSPLRSHQDILSIANLIHQHIAKEDILDMLLQSFYNGERTSIRLRRELVDHSIDLVASLLVMMAVGTNYRNLLTPYRLTWIKGTLKDQLREYYDMSPVRHLDNVKLDAAFVARKFETYGGIVVLWTDDLALHLSLADNDKSVHIFHQVTFLEAYLHAGHDDMFPPGFLQETLNTLALLFPCTDSGTQTWLASVASKNGAEFDSQLGKSGCLTAQQRRIENFLYWHDRLAILKEVVDQSRPKTISGIWRDRRNRDQWFNSWIAIVVVGLTLFFGLIQSIEGAIQAYRSYHPIPA